MRNAIALAYWYNESRLFYSDIQRGAIHTARFDATDHRSLIEQVGAVEGMSVDGTTGTLYWTCASAAAVRAADLRALLQRRPHTPRTIVTLQHDDRPRGIDVDPCDRCVTTPTSELT
ncbi:unnamed protein product [Diatraea saccharalis]|uniref:Uncharacterized protein n=1 Tax=Diatraea saccharalis TaxID=40085 RepID=A0A9N9WIL0_9NEOP|nr:unnamed protein product [Diatraea saccharalis]